MQKHQDIIKAETTDKTSFRHHPKGQHLGSVMGRVTDKNWTTDIATRRGLTQRFVACDSSNTCKTFVLVTDSAS